MGRMPRLVERGKKDRRLGEPREVSWEEIEALELEPRVELIRQLIPLGLAEVGRMLEEEVEQLAGQRHARKTEDDRHYRHGHNPGSVRLGGQRHPVRVPRVRGPTGESRLAAYEQLHGSPGEMDEGLFRKVLLGISCRDYEAAVEAVPGAIGLSKSTVSREFKKATAAKLKEFQERDLSGYDVVALVLDGKSFAEDEMVVVLGVTTKGDKVFLGFVQTKPVPEQAEAFCDTWEMDAEKDRIARNMPVLMKQYGVEQYYVDFWRLWMQALRHTQPHLLAYLIYMVQRLLHMKVILKPTGAIYLHCDPAASHYIKVMMDGIFGHTNFCSEIIWKRTSAHSGAKRYGPVHDVILYYTVSDEYTWNKQFQDYDPVYVDAFFTHEDEEGRRWRRTDLTGPGTRKGDSGLPWKDYDPTDRGRHWQPPSYFYEKYHSIVGEDLAQYGLIDRLDKLEEAGLIHRPKKEGGMPQGKRYLEDAPGVPLQDIWTDIKPIHNISSKRLGYPTQKPMAVLDRIIRSSTNEGDVVFDPFCGCGTTIYAAHEADRQWIGCDVAILAVRLVEGQLLERYGLVEGEHYEEHGIPNSVASAKALFEHDPFQFEHWAVEYVGGFPTKKTGDKGIDGRIYFETKRELGLMVLSVKGGNVRPTDIRDLIGVLSVEEGAELAGFISNKEPSKAMKAAAGQAGQWEYEDVAYDRVQLLTVKEIVEDKKRFHTPTK